MAAQPAPSDVAMPASQWTQALFTDVQ